MKDKKGMVYTNALIRFDYFLIVIIMAVVLFFILKINRVI